MDVIQLDTRLFFKCKEGGRLRDYAIWHVVISWALKLNNRSERLGAEISYLEEERFWSVPEFTNFWKGKRNLVSHVGGENETCGTNCPLPLLRRCSRFWYIFLEFRKRCQSQNLRIILWGQFTFSLSSRRWEQPSSLLLSITDRSITRTCVAP